MAKKFSLNRSQRAKLSYEIRKFNETMNKIHGNSPLNFEYNKVAPYLGNKREYTQFINRLQRLQKPSQQRIHETSKGIQYTQWEKQELSRMNKKANKMRGKARERAKEEAALGYRRVEDKNFYDDRKYNLNNLFSHKELNWWIHFEFREGTSKVRQVRDERYLDNMITALDKWPQIKPIRELKKFLKEQDPSTVALLALDQRFNLSIQEAYEAKLAATYSDDTTLVSSAESLLDHWKSAVSMYDKYGRL